VVARRGAHQTNAGSEFVDQDGLDEPLPPGAGRVVDRALLLGAQDNRKRLTNPTYHFVVDFAQMGG
jgi:hypothetical protein